MEMIAIIALLVVAGVLSARIIRLTAQRTAAQTELNIIKQKNEEQKQELKQMQEGFRAEFKNLANDIFDQKNRQFKESNKENMEALLTPFKLNIAEFRERVEKIYANENTERGALKTEIKNLLELNRKITEETTNLTNALKGNSKVQGDWGEMILETILESSNLVRGVHYVIQESIHDDSGAVIRPDVVLNLPEGKQIVIDSKVSLKAFVDYSSAQEDGPRTAHLKAHLLSIRRHVDELGKKSYQNSLPVSPDFVVMFVANEPAFIAAMQQDNAIWSDAYAKKVIISSPTNLFALLKIVDDMWKRDNQSKNALAIAEEGGKLYDKFMSLLESIEDIGKSIKRASDSYEKAKKQLSEGTGNLITRTKKLKQMGVKASKNIPTAFLPDISDEQ